MSSFKITNTIGLIDDDLITDADEFRTSSKKPVYLKFIAAAAACLCAAGGAAVIAKTQSAPDHMISSVSMVVDRGDPAGKISENNLSSAAPVIKMSEVHFNEIPDIASISTAGDIDLSIFDDVLWDSEDITEYFGWDLTPAYIPEGLVPSKRNGSMRAYFQKDDGRIVIDRAVLSFYHNYDENGYPVYTEDVDAKKGFELIASKIGSLDLCLHFDPRNFGAESSSINGTEVFFVHFSVPVGGVTAPSGYYDEYIAEFNLDGIRYRVTTDQLEADEIVKIVSSIICGDSFSVEE